MTLSSMDGHFDSDYFYEIGGSKLEKYTDHVRVRCHVCKLEHDNTMVFGTDKRYPDDFFIACKHCGNTEEGSQPAQFFDILQDYGRTDGIKPEDDWDEGS